MKTRLALGAAAVLLAGCGGDDERLTVYAAASLTEVFQQLDADARFNFAGSDELATQIREGAEADVYAAASPRYAEELFREGLVEQPRVFATNRLVLIVSRRSDDQIRTLADVRRDGVKLVIAAEGVPAGDYAREALERAGATDLLERAVSEEEDVKGVLGKVALGEADAGFVYATDARTAAAKVRTIALPRAIAPEIRYPAAVVSDTDRPAAAEKFVDDLFGARARTLLRAAGFGVP
jgi:molybdate transport system substrate-binding protein